MKSEHDDGAFDIDTVPSAIENHTEWSQVAGEKNWNAGVLDKRVSFGGKIWKTEEKGRRRQEKRS